MTASGAPGAASEEHLDAGVLVGQCYVSMRFLALLLLLAVLPTAELTEQVVHVVEHVLDAEAPDHTAHHDALPGDEHGCTGLVHLCACHHTQVTAAVAMTAIRAVEAQASLAVGVPASLADLTSLEPTHRPPIG